ncbi:MAG TPA: glycosyltransferase family 2 protein [Chitinophagaceae bacterium]
MEAAQPLVSVAMATYNGERYLREQLDSILQQTWQNMELVIVDDGSSDGTVDIIREYQAAWSFIHLHRNETNLGVTKTFEKAISLCTGEYIALSDQDDLWMPAKIETLVAHIGDHDAVYSNTVLVNSEGKLLGKTFKDLMNLKSYYHGAPFLLSNTVAGHTMMLKRSFAQSILPFPPELFFDLWIAFNAASGNGLKYVDEGLVHYRQHGGNVVGTRHSSNKRTRKSRQQQYEEKLQELKELAKAPVKDQQTQAILNEMIRLFKRRWSLRRSAFFFRHFNEILVSKKKPQYRKLLYCAKMFFKPNF